MPKNKKQKLQHTHNATEKPKFNFKLLGFLFLSTLVIFGTYRIFIALEISAIIWVYIALVCILIVAYFLMNKGVLSAVPAPENLPDDWTDEKKFAYISERKERREKSKFILILLIPFLICFFFDVIELFYIDKIKSLFNK